MSTKVLTFGLGRRTVRPDEAKNGTDADIQKQPALSVTIYSLRIDSQQRFPFLGGQQLVRVAGGSSAGDAYVKALNEGKNSSGAMKRIRSGLLWSTIVPICTLRGGEDAKYLRLEDLFRKLAGSEPR